MKKLAALALCLWLLLPSAALAQGIGAQPIVCNKVVASATLPAATTQLVVGATNQLIDVCGYVIQGVTAGTVQLVAGTGASCTSPTNITSVFVTSTTSLAINHIATAYFSTVVGQSICAVVTGTATVELYYAQP